ncbi:uncharacterized protein LOC110693594 [Chenopodium quinoa]|uniref:uncharacterized protein LOC110693594 n=1 Tax=Chenopodium quinoa TaxID=63459 RepID=UPI000B77CD06|nr:uncharacterized protein LOC110693594 [Chenopodium quinoa]
MDVLQRKLNSLLDSTTTNNNTSQSSSSSISPTVLPTPLPLPGHYTFKTEDIDKVLRFGGRSRLTAPDQFLIKIKSYKDLLQSLKDTQTCEFETPTFSFAQSGNMKWLMSIYFKGDQDANADDHISLYLKRWVDPKQNIQYPPITVLVRFFIYNYETKEYLTIQDVKEQVFSDKLDRKAGISRAIKIADFEEPTNGFLRGDKCRFGVEMKVLENRPSNSEFLVVPNLINQWGKITFPSSSYRNQPDPISTESFKVDDYTWKVQIYPNGRSSEQNQSFSVFLVLQKTTSTANEKHVYAEFELILKDKNNGPDISKKGFAWFTQSDNTKGFEDFISIAEFKKTDKYTKDNSLIIHVHIKKLYKQV